MVLTDEQRAVWLSYRRMHVRLMAELDRQLARDSQMPPGYYAVLATLAGQPGHRMLLAQLARACSFSQSRLSHAVVRMEELGWVQRVDAGAPRRSSYAQLTSLGASVQHAAAQGHDQLVRELVFDPLTAAQAEQLRVICDAVALGQAPSAARSDP